ncbi:MAG: adenylosuccinate synthase [Thermomicrobiales bacterium]
MPVTVVLGGQWGDEGKGQITDTLAREADIVARATGGSNAGHTVINEQGSFAVHLIPSGIFTPGITCVLGNGMVIGPQTLINEMDALAAHGIDLSRLHISDKAHLVMPYHPTLDALEEERRGEAAIGTTRRGIGPAYMDKMARSGVRVADLLDEEALRSRLSFLLPYRNDQFVKIFSAEPVALEPLVTEMLAYGERLRPYVTQTEMLIQDALDAGKHVLVEGAQASLLDPDFGTYPFVTSSSPTAAGACLGTGIAPSQVTTVLGVFKAYCSRVGAGPMPTELMNAVGDEIRQRGREYGTTTGRPRRTGWFDAVAARYVIRLNGISRVALTGIGVLGAFETIKVCTAYRINGEEVKTIPTLAEAYARAEPVYEEWPGWQSDTSEASAEEDLPPNARAYIARLEELLGAEIVLVGVGQQRRQLVRRGAYALEAAVS